MVDFSGMIENETIYCYFFLEWKDNDMNKELINPHQKIDIVKNTKKCDHHKFNVRSEADEIINVIDVL